MRFSIVVPVYNVSEYLQPCVDSILANDCSDCEIILVDDGCTDGLCPQICDSLAAQHPNLIRVIHQENMGLGGARNSGLESALGEYMLFVDSDDTLESTALSTLSRAVDLSDADIIAFNIYSDDGEGHLSPVQANAFVTEDKFCLSDRPDFLLSLPSAVCRLWRRRLFIDSDIRYPSRVWYEDIRTSTKLFALADSIYTIDDKLYRYLQRPGSIMNSGSLARNTEILLAFDDILTWFRNHGLFDKYLNELCMLTINHVLLVGSVRVARINPHSDLLPTFSSYVREHFPEHESNPYLAQLSTLHRILLRLLKGRHYRTVRTLFAIKEKI